MRFAVDDRNDNRDGAGAAQVTVGIHWFRDDLRLQDNRALSALADEAESWLPVFIADARLLTEKARRAPRVAFMFDCVTRLAADLAERGVELLMLEGDPESLIPMLISTAEASVVSWTTASSPFGRRRDATVAAGVSRVGGRELEVHDRTVFGPDEIKTKTGGHYSVYTPYRNEWWRNWERYPRLSSSRVRLPKKPFEIVPAQFPDRVKLEECAQSSALGLPVGGEAGAKRRLRRFLDGPAARYHIDRDIPGLDGTSRLSPYLRFGALSVRRCFTDALQEIDRNPQAREGVSKWLDELIWREFYHAVLVNSPRVLSGSFRPEYDEIQWTGTDEEFEAWCAGQTGYPFVDAGMRQLKATGWMHNRLRMVVASFLIKDLRIDWRRGERFFFDSLVDGDPAANNGGWQWSASTGTDAQPYFRIFNPTTQGCRFDPEGDYIRKWVPELRHLDSKRIHSPWENGDQGLSYPPPIVDHAAQRLSSIAEYKRVRRVEP